MKVEISQAVHDALAAAGRTADDVLREALHVKPAGLVCEGVQFPEGTRFMVWYKERPYWGTVKDGAIEIQDKRYTSPSSAAKHVTNRPTNGWEFWQVMRPGEGVWTKIDKLRPEATRGNGGSKRKRG